MKKFLTLTAILSAVVIATYFMACKGKKSEKHPDNKEDSIKIVLARGEYLAVNVAGCIDCHSSRDFTKYGGPVVTGTEGQGGFVFDTALLAIVPGKIYSRNITPDSETGIGTWTDDEILRALRKGINKNGDTLFPIMPYYAYNKMAKDDLLSIIAYIRTLKPIKNKVPARLVMIPVSEYYSAKNLENSIDSIVRPSSSDRIKYGEYLTTLAECKFCHTGGGGGLTFNTGLSKVSAANITPDSATGIGTWTEDRFLNKFTAFREEKNYNFPASKENTIMPVIGIGGMTDEDLKAIYAYLRTLKPISKHVEKYPK